MIDPRDKLFVFHDDNGSFIDVTNNAHDYGRDAFSLEIVALEDKLYVGFEDKPINAIYLEFGTANTNSSAPTLKYYNGTSFEVVGGFHDDTNNLLRSGYIVWDRHQRDANGKLDQEKTTINSQEAYWYEFSFSADFSVGTTVQGLNIVLADDNDLEYELAEIDEFRADNRDSFILMHQAVRDDIVQTIRNRGIQKQRTEADRNKQGGSTLRDITPWDLLDHQQLKQAAKYLALSKIFFNVSDAIDDKWYQKYQDYKRLGDESLNLFIMDIDTQNDGVVDNNDRVSFQRVTVTRI